MESKTALSKLGLNKATDKSKILRLEKKIITTNPLRRDYIIDLIKDLKENSLVLFQDVSGKYGKELQERLKDELPSDKYEVFYVSGEVSKELREEYRKRTNLTEKITIMVASFGTFSTGIDINNLHYIILAESYKSERLIKQSIGRGMRLMKGKLEVVIIDLIDDFRTNKWDNFIYKHGIARRAIYANENFPVSKIKIKLS